MKYYCIYKYGEQMNVSFSISQNRCKLLVEKLRRILVLSTYNVYKCRSIQCIKYIGFEIKIKFILFDLKKLHKICLWDKMNTAPTRISYTRK